MIPVSNIPFESTPPTTLLISDNFFSLCLTSLATTYPTISPVMFHACVILFPICAYCFKKQTSR